MGHGRKPPNPQNAPRFNGRKQPAPRPRAGGDSACCSYQEAAKAIIRLEFRLAIRYVRMDVKARLGIIGSRV